MQINVSVHFLPDLKQDKMYKYRVSVGEKNEMKPLIGITTVGEKYERFGYRYYSPKSYAEAILKAGGLPVLIPLIVMETQDTEVLRGIYERLDGVLIPGGGDIHPEYYQQYITPEILKIDRTRDLVEINLAKWAYEDKRPLLGICRGQQVINVALGGTLIHDIPSQNNTPISHDQPVDISPSVLIHEVMIDTDSKLANLLDTTTIKVNSLHHQSIDAVASVLKVTAHAEDGIIEAVEAPDAAFYLGVQWHPEWLTTDPAMQKLFKAFIAACEVEAQKKAFA